MRQTLHIYAKERKSHSIRGSREGSCPPTPEKLQVAIGSLSNSDTDPNEKQLDPIGSRGRSAHVLPSLKCIDD